MAAREWTGPIGMLYIDGEHTYNSVINDYLSWAPHVVDGCPVVFDDYRVRNEPVKRAVDDLAQEGYLSRPEVYGDRLAVCTKL